MCTNIRLYILGLPICKDIGTSILRGSAIFTTPLSGKEEDEIIGYLAEIKSLEKQVDTAIIQLGELDQTAENAVTLMTNKINLMAKWQEVAENVENTIADFTMEQIQSIDAFQNTFANSIKRLKTSAYAMKLS